MKNLLFVLESLNCGGQEKSLVALLQNLDYSKYQVDLILIVKDSAFEKFLPKEVNLIIKKPLDNLNSFQLLSKRMNLKLLKKFNPDHYHHAQLFWKVFGKQIPKHDKNYDVVFAMSQGFPTYYVATKVAAKIKYCYVNIDYKIAGYNPNFDAPFYDIYQNIISVSDQCDAIFVREMALIGKKYNTEGIRDITDVYTTQKLSLEGKTFPKSDRVKIATVCRLTHQKGIDMAIEACAILKNKGYNIDWRVIGEGVLRPKLEALITKLNVADSFRLEGFNENPFGYMKSADIYAQTSVFEGLGLTVVEAKILEKPIVCTNFPTVVHILEDTITGLICEMNPTDIAEKIQIYIDNPELKNKIVNNLKNPDNTEKEITLKRLNELMQAQ